MKQLSPEQWRVLNFLYDNKRHVVRPKLTYVRKTQHVADTDVYDLEARGLITAYLVDVEHVIGKVPDELVRYVRLRLTSAGLKTVLDDPGNQIRYTLGQYSRSVALAKLFDDNAISLDDVLGVYLPGHIRIAAVLDGEDVELDNVSAAFWAYCLFVSVLNVSLTTKGREYLPR